MDKKEIIRESAIKIIAQEGYHNTRVQMIADQAQIAVGTVYNYFANKKEILNYIFAIEFKKRLNLLKRLQDEDISFKEKLITFLDQHFKELELSSDATSVLVQESQLPRKHSLEAVNDFMTKLPELLAKMIDEGKQKGEIREINSDLVAYAIFNSIRGMARKVAIDANYDFAQAKRELINLLWLGIGK